MVGVQVFVDVFKIFEIKVVVKKVKKDFEYFMCDNIFKLVIQFEEVIGLEL